MARPAKYRIDNKYFEKINTPNKAYILGFLYADGSVDERGCSIGIAEKDEEILNFIWGA